MLQFKKPPYLDARIPRHVPMRSLDFILLYVKRSGTKNCNGKVQNIFICWIRHSEWTDMSSFIYFCTSCFLKVPGRDSNITSSASFHCWHFLTDIIKPAYKFYWKSQHNLTCNGCNLVFVLPRASIVVTANPCKAQMGVKHAFLA